MTVNKLDRCFLELMMDGEEAYNGFRRVIESANVIMATYADELLGDTQARFFAVQVQIELAASGPCCCLSSGGTRHRSAAVSGLCTSFWQLSLPCPRSL